MKPLFRAFLLLTTFSWVCLAGEPATAVATITAGFVTDITVTPPGSGYESKPTVTITAGVRFVPICDCASARGFASKL